MKKRIKNKGFILLLAIVLLMLFSFYTKIGSDYYLKVLPYYDSLSYQTDFKFIINSYNKYGYLSNFFTLLHPSTYFLPKLLTIIMAPILPPLPFGFYVILYICGFYACMNSAFVMSRSGIPRLTILNTFLFLFSLNIFSIVNGGILDQRLDLVASLLFLNVLFSFWHFLLRSSLASLIIVAISGLALATFRPILVLPLVTVLLTLLCLDWPNTQSIKRILNWRYLFILAVAALALLVLIWPSHGFMHYYYFVWNRDFGTNTGLLAILSLAAKYLYAQTSLIFLAIFGLLILLDVVGKKRGLKYLLLSIAAIAPYLLTRSTNSLVYYPVVMTIVFTATQFINALSPNIKSLLFTTLLFMTLINIRQLTTTSRSVDSQPREKAMRLLKMLSPTSRQNFISSLTPEGSSLLALDYLYGNSSFIKGRLISHKADLQNKTLDKSIHEICHFKGYLFTLGPNYPNYPDHYLWTYRHNRAISEIVNSTPCYRRLKISYELNDIEYAVYAVE